MARWADYLISDVTYSKPSAVRRISRLLVHTEEDGRIGAAEIWTRKEIIKEINKGRSFITIYSSKEKSWRKGESVKIVTVEGKSFLRTDETTIEGDDLGSIPEFGP